MSWKVGANPLSTAWESGARIFGNCSCQSASVSPFVQSTRHPLEFDKVWVATSKRRQ